MPPENPYRVLGPQIPNMLGRAELAERVQARLDQKEPEHVSVVGPAMFGKSVLLREIARRYATGHSGFVTSVYVDMRHGNPQSDDEARHLVAEAMQRSLEPIHPELSEYFELDGVRVKERLQAVIQELAAADERLLIVLDGMDNTMANPRITREI
jgi:ATP/maltotriose-dependent transcriptional regulator MalT